MQSITDIPRVSALNRDEFITRYYVQSKPVVITDYAKSWPAIQKWDARYLCDHLTQETVLCSRSASRKHPDFAAMHGQQTRAVQMSFREYVKHICTAPEDEIPKLALNRLVFMTGSKCEQKLHLNLDSLLDELKVPDLIPADDLEVGVTWIQGQGVQSWLHCDPYDNLYVQIRGRKHIQLMDPAYWREVYLNTTNKGYCEVDAFEPDFEAFPMYASVPIVQTILEPGELLYMPVFWFHAIQSLGPVNITTNWWYRRQNLPLSQPSIWFLLQRLLIHAFNHAADEESARAVSKTSHELQQLLFGEKFLTTDDFYLRS